MSDKQIDDLDNMMKSVFHLRNETQLMTTKCVTTVDPWLQQMMKLISAQKTIKDLIKVEFVEDDVELMKKKVDRLMGVKTDKMENGASNVPSRS